MQNSFEHVGNGITKISVTTKKPSADKYQMVLISTDDFDKINDATSGYWFLLNQKGKDIVATNFDGKYAKMSRVITGMHNDRKKVVMHANDDVLDLRRENLMVANQGEQFTEEFKTKQKEIAENLTSYSKISNNESQTSNLYIEKNMINNQISFTVNDSKRVLKSLTEEDARLLIEIFKELNVKIE